MSDPTAPRSPGSGTSVADGGSTLTVAPGAVPDEALPDEAPEEVPEGAAASAPDDGRGGAPGNATDRTSDVAPGAEPVMHPRVWQRRVAVLREQGHRRLRWVVGGVVVLVALCIALLALHTPLLALRHVTVRGAQHTGSHAVLGAAGLLDDPPLIDVDPKAAAARVDALPWVERTVVERRWPDSVTVIVTERAPLGSLARPNGGIAVVDASGRVLAWRTTLPPGLVLVAPVTPGRPGTVLAPGARPVLDVAAALRAPLAERVREVSVDAHGVVRMDLGGGITAVLGSTTGLQAKLVALASVLAGAHLSPPAVIDVTVPEEPTVAAPPPG